MSTVSTAIALSLLHCRKGRGFQNSVSCSCLGEWVNSQGKQLCFFHFCLLVGWLVGCFRHNGPLRQYFCLYQAVSQRKKRVMIDVRKMSKQPPPAPPASTEGPCSTFIRIKGRSGTRTLPSTIASPDQPTLLTGKNYFFTGLLFALSKNIFKNLSHINN